MKKALLIILAVIIFVLSVCGGFFLGFKYHEMNYSSETEQNEDKNVKTETEGVFITLEANTADGSEPSDEDIEIAKNILRARLDGKGYTEADIRIKKNNRFVIILPLDVYNEDHLTFLTKSAVLELRDADGNLVLEGKDIKDAVAEYSAIDELGTNQHQVVLSLNSEAREKFRKATMAAATRTADGTNYIAIYLDDEVISTPFVDGQYATTGIDSDEVIINMGNAADGQASAELANLIKSGALPFELEIIEFETIDYID